MLKLLAIIKNITKGKTIKTDPKSYDMTKNILTGEALWVFEHKSQEKCNVMTTDYKLLLEITAAIKVITGFQDFSIIAVIFQYFLAITNIIYIYIKIYNDI